MMLNKGLLDHAFKHSDVADLPLPNLKRGDRAIGKVAAISEHGLFIALEEGCKDGLLHISQLNLGPGETQESKYNQGDELEVQA